jgi:hypothetical protein
MPLIPGITFEEITAAFEAAYDRDDLREMLRKRMNEKLENMTGPNDKWKTAVFNVVNWSEQHGKTARLIRVAYEYNPDHPGMQSLYEKYGLTGVDLQKGGAGADPTKPSQGGFEETIKTRLPMLDFGVWREKMAAVEGRVCRVLIDGNAAGTGFLVGPDAVLTNYHVLRAVLAIEPKAQRDAAAKRVTCQFDYKALPTGARSDGISVGLHPTDWEVDSSPHSPAEKTTRPDDPPPTADELDYALVRLTRQIGEEPVPPSVPGAPRRGWLTLPVGPLAFVPKDPIIIAQYPDGNPLKVALDTESVIGEVANGLRVRYRTNTKHGSSGSPVFDLAWVPVALHHLGDPAADLPPTYNQGVPLDKIRARVSKAAAARAALG